MCMGSGIGFDAMNDTAAPADDQAAPTPEEPKMKKQFNPLDAVRDVIKSPLPQGTPRPACR